MKIEDLKKEYDNMQIPKMAEECVRKGVGQAKREKKVTRLQNIVKKAGMTAAAAMLVLTVLVNSDPSIASAMEQVPVIGKLAKVVAFRDYQNQTGRSEADIKVPQIEQEGAAIGANQTIEEYAQSLIADYEEELLKTNGEAYYSVESDYDVVTDTEKYLSIRITTVLTSASAMEMHKIFTIDRSTGNIVSLKEITAGQDGALDAITQNIKDQMKAQMAADENISYFVDDEETDGFTHLTGEESFYINENQELVISFDEYEVAPGYMGVVEFTIPQSVFTLSR